ncbi:MAG TPA: hypothetical protein PLM07_09705 [Candidatus Rifleibacterium sp.]|nr:hypothetical protein [Candidatus Rifleibacterium sp.]HPT46162.1 hypothetical protein [Candidatus Rifleibacterium sp.]
MPERKLQIPFDPWTATEEEAKLETKRRRKLKEKLAAKLKDIAADTEEWHDALPVANRETRALGPV